jgi:mono/diheme cytochrome c family protein/Flp pilus assembly protein TadD
MVCTRKKRLPLLRKVPSVPLSSFFLPALLGLSVLLVVVATFFFCPGGVAGLLRKAASRDIVAGRLARAQLRLDRAAWLTPDDYRTELLRAACSRHLGEMDGWAADVEAARRYGAPAAEADLEHRLGLVQSGRFETGVEREITGLTWSGASSHDLATSVVLGLVANNDLEAARNFLDAGIDPAPDRAQMDYLRGACNRCRGDFAEAESRLTRALAFQPDHEPARAELAALFEEQGHLARALDEYAELAARSGGRETAVLGPARVLRQLGRFAAARRAMLPLAAQSAPSASVAMQMGQIEADLGNYAEAERWLRRLPLEATMDSKLLTIAARTFGLQGKTIEAERLCTRIAALSDRALDAYNLQARVAADPADLEAAGQLRRLYGTPLAPTDLSVAAISPDGEPNPFPSRAAELYAAHCSACHGKTGDGRGRAARHVFPRPSDLRADRCKLVSTVNGVPTPEDLEAVLRRGMPGTSMPAFDKLSESDRKLLIQEVLRCQRQGMREQLVRWFREAGDEIDEESIQTAIRECTAPGETIRSPAIASATDEGIARGKETYRELGCNKCHGDQGRFCPEPDRFDDRGYPDRPRDLVYEPFKGGREPESIYLRISAGMPGTDHPAVHGLSRARVADLVQYVRSLAREPELVLTNHQRWTVAEPAAYRAEFEDRQR